MTDERSRRLLARSVSEGYAAPRRPVPSSYASGFPGGRRNERLLARENCAQMSKYGRISGNLSDSIDWRGEHVGGCSNGDEAHRAQRRWASHGSTHPTLATLNS